MVMRKVGLIVTGIAILAIVIWQLFKVVTFAEPLTMGDAKDKIQDMYNGKIIEITEVKTWFRITLLLDTGTYEVKVNKETGEVGLLTKKNMDTATSNNDEEGSIKNSNPSTPTPEDNQEPKEPVKQISEAEAISIALTKVNGEVDDVDLEQSNGESYYLVSIETVNGEEGIVQVHAITGEVMSITWDD